MRHDHLYENSVACCVEYNSETLVVERASGGVYEILGINGEELVQGQRLQDLLGIPTSELEVITARIKEGQLDLITEIQCQPPSGEKIKLELSGYYIERSRLVEIALLVSQHASHGSPDGRRVSRAMERVRRSMVHRESRILELKTEVNDLLRNADQPARYKVDVKSKDRHFGFHSEEQKMGGDADATK